MGNNISLEEYKKWNRRLILKEEKRFFLKHFTVYIVVNILLLFILFLHFIDLIDLIIPFFWWGTGVLLHYLWAVHFLEKRLKSNEEEAMNLAKRSK
ncbi:hypothetical protein CMO93_03180 [Candidatus Woesearchaeota archaeon]|nr:hypothetical protein [Candidatus Woesearchaeota archaeon]|tara:strand:- start:2850 stop:3137 length:288 start_codon:yes stop_codon:yes gene_type:complete